jgi:hypothetical protein
MEPDKIDPELITGEGTAYHAFSPRLYAAQMLVPWLNANFKPKASFTAAGATAAGGTRIPFEDRHARGPEDPCSHGWSSR